MMHWQFAWFQPEYFAHHVLMSRTLDVDPQGQEAQPPGQFEPHVVDPVVRVVELPKAVLIVPAEARAKKARTTSNVNIILII